MKVSVVIPAYNCAKYLSECLDSIINQSHDNLEILISDDGSTDGTRQVIEQYDDPRIFCHHNDINRGNVFTRNKLFELATGDYICIQDADDYSDLNRIENQLNAMISNNLSVSATNFKRVDNSGNAYYYKPFNDFVSEINCELKGDFVLASLMMHSKVYKDIGGLPKALSHMIAEDKYWCSLICEKYQISVLGSPLYYYRNNPESLTNDDFNEEVLISTALIKELRNQRKKQGFDWVEKDSIIEIEKFKNNLKSNRDFMCKQFLIRALKYLPHDLNKAAELLERAKAKSFLKTVLSKTYLIYLRVKLLGK